MSEQTFDIVHFELECHANPRPSQPGASQFSEIVVESFATFEAGKVALMRYPRAAGYGLHCPNGDQFIWRDDGKGGINWVKISPTPPAKAEDSGTKSMGESLQWLADMRAT